MRSFVRKSLAAVAVCALAVFVSSGFMGCVAKANQESKTAESAKSSEKKGAKKAADSASIKVVVAEVKARAFEDWGSYSADLRGPYHVDIEL